MLWVFGAYLDFFFDQYKVGKGFFFCVSTEKLVWLFKQSQPLKSHLPAEFTVHSII